MWPVSAAARTTRTMRRTRTSLLAVAVAYTSFSTMQGTSVAHAADAASGGASAPSGPPVGFSPKEWRGFPITEAKKLNHDTKVFRLALPTSDHVMGMGVASCILIKGPNREGTEDVVRPYTPTSTNDEKGYFDLLIKAYPKGNISTYMHTLSPGDKVQVKGPFPKLQYSPNMKKRIGMIAGGSGITPMLQVLHEVVNNPKDTTEVTLLFGNKSPEDILLKAELDSMAAKHDQIKVVYKVDSHAPSDNWTGAVGHIDSNDVDTHMPSPQDADGLVLLCGPPPMVDALAGPKAEDKSQGELTGMLKNKGFAAENVYKF